MTFNKKEIILVLLCLLTGQTALTQSIVISDFEMNKQEQEVFIDSLISSIQDHPVYLESLAIVGSSKASLDIAQSANKPQIQFQGNSRNSLKQKFNNPLSALTESSKDQHRADGSLIMQQSLFDPIIKEEISKQEYILQADYYNNQQKVSELTLDMAIACQDTAAYKIISDLIDISIDSHSQIVGRIKMRVESGRAAQAEMMRAEARLAEAQAKKMTIDLKLQSARAKFSQLIVDTKPCLKFLNVDSEQLINDSSKVRDAIEENYSIMKANELIKASERELEKAKAGFKPKINLELRGDRYDLTGDQNYDLYAGVNFNVDIYTGGKKKALVRLAEEQLNSSTLKKEILLKELKIKSEANLAELENSSERLAIFNNAFEAYEQSKNKLSLQFESSNVSLLELLQAERDYIESAELLIINKKEINSSQLRQLFLLGKIIKYFEQENTVNQF
jgi:outer membrane protein TolC